MVRCIYCIHCKKWYSDLVESAVIKSIYELFSSVDNLHQAIENALSKSRDITALLKKQIKQCKTTLTRLDKEKDRLVNSILKGILEDADCQDQMSRIKDGIIENKERLKMLESQLEQVDVEVGTNELAEKINRHYHLLIEKDISIQDLDYEQQKLLVDWYFGMSKDTGVYLMKDKEHGVIFNMVGAFNSSYLGTIQKEWNNALILGFKEDIEQPFISKAPNVQVDFKRLLVLRTAPHRGTATFISTRNSI